MIKTIEDAIDLAKKHSNDGYEYLYRKTYKYNYYVALKIVKNEAITEDVLQDSYIKAFDCLDTLEDTSKFKSWMAQIVSHKALDEVRKNNPLLFSETEDEEGSDISATFVDDRLEYNPEISLDKSETSRLVNEILDTLSEEQKICTLMYYGQELSVKEIATSLDVSENTVKSRLSYARKNIKEKVLELEKKGTKLYGLVPIVFFAMLLKNEANAAELAPEIAFTSASMFGNTSAKGVFGALKTASVKIVAAVVSVSVITGTAIGVHTLSKPEETGLYIDFNNTGEPYKFIRYNNKVQSIEDEKGGFIDLLYFTYVLYKENDYSDVTMDSTFLVDPNKENYNSGIFIREYSGVKFIYCDNDVYKINDDNSLVNVRDTEEPLISNQIDDYKLTESIQDSIENGELSEYVNLAKYFDTSKNLYGNYEKQNDKILALIDATNVTDLSEFYAPVSDDNSYEMDISGVWTNDTSEIAVSGYTDYITGEGDDYYVGIAEIDGIGYHMYAEDKKGFTTENVYLLEKLRPEYLGDGYGYKIVFYSNDTIRLFYHEDFVAEYELVERLSP